MIYVVAAAVVRGDGRVLIAQRPPGRHLAGGWEFPGGKLEAGESRVAALSREIREELGIEIREPRPLLRLRHTYPYGEVLIDMWVVTRFDGEPRGLEGQALEWCTQGELATADLLPADRPIVRALCLPEQLTLRSTAHYEVGAANDAPPRVTEASRPLRGALCPSVEDAIRCAQRGDADFLVMQNPLSGDELRGTCDAVCVPLYARGLALEAAWAQGATGISLIAN